ncbi:MAG: hypothetical protein WDN04_24015 [Rhodospirillales bacterium]
MQRRIRLAAAPVVLRRRARGALRKQGVAVVADLPGVGENLQDHIDHVQNYRTFASQDTFGVSPSGTLDIVRAMAEWKKQRTGRITSTYAESGAFIRSRRRSRTPTCN